MRCDPKSLRDILAYDSETGLLTWLERHSGFFVDERSARAWNGRFAGKPAFTARDNYGYLCGSLLGQGCRAHRVIWALEYGEWPDGEIDHINGRRDDNRIANLRLVSHLENGRNQARPHDNKSGHMGVYWNNKCGKWRVTVRTGKKTHHFGQFAELTDAVAARDRAYCVLGFHPNHGRAA